MGVPCRGAVEVPLDRDTSMFHLSDVGVCIQRCEEYESCVGIEIPSSPVSGKPNVVVETMSKCRLSVRCGSDKDLNGGKCSGACMPCWRKSTSAN